MDFGTAAPPVGTASLMSLAARALLYIAIADHEWNRHRQSNGKPWTPKCGEYEHRQARRE